jgi:hypothetical protein
MTPLTITQIVAALYTALQAWGQPLGAIVTIARDPFQILEILAASPEGFRVVLHWSGDRNISDHDPLPLAENTLDVILSYNLGLTARPDLALIQGPLDRPGVLDQIDSLRSFILSVEYPTVQTGTYAVYSGTKPYATPEGIPLAAYILTFKLKAAVNVNPTPTPIA